MAPLPGVRETPGIRAGKPRDRPQPCRRIPRTGPSSARPPPPPPGVNATLLSRLGPALDGPGRLQDTDAWYFILEGTSEPSVAEAQAMAVTELIAHAATSRTARPRRILLAADDYSAVRDATTAGRRPGRCP